MNNEVKERVIEHHSLEVKNKTSKILKDSTDYLKKMKRSIADLKEFNRRAKKYLEAFRRNDDV